MNQYMELFSADDLGRLVRASNIAQGVSWNHAKSLILEEIFNDERRSWTTLQPDAFLGGSLALVGPAQCEAPAVRHVFRFAG